MRAVEILQEKLGETLAFMHAKQRRAMWRVVGGLLNGHELWLTELGRNLPGECAIKHRVKAVDRFLGGEIQSSLTRVYAALAGYLLRNIERPVILVDWTGVGHGYFELSAQVAFSGRALTILARTYPEKRKSTPKAEREFLKELSKIVPPHCRPVLIADAGFLCTWMRSVRSLGWDYVCRVRQKRMYLYVGGRCMTLDEAYCLAKKKPRDLGTVLFGQKVKRPDRAILSPRPKPKGRQRLNLNGKSRASGVAVRCIGQARDPLLLVTSLNDSARVIVALYKLRMQIEQAFRDKKSYRYGWSSRLIRSDNPRRIDVLFLIAALAMVAMHFIGLAVRGTELARGFQVNTERSRAVFSTFFLARLLLNDTHTVEPSLQSLRNAARDLTAQLGALERIPS